MSKTEKSAIIRRIKASKEYSSVQKKMLLRVYSMTPQEGFKSLVSAGIYSPSGRLRAKYRLAKAG